MHVEVNVLYELLTMFGDDAAPIEPGAEGGAEGQQDGAAAAADSLGFECAETLAFEGAEREESGGAGGGQEDKVEGGDGEARVKASVCLDSDTPDDEEQNEKDMAVDHWQKEGDEKKKKKEQVEQEKDQRTKVEKDKDPPEALQKREAQANRADTSIVTLCWTLLEFLTYVLRETWIVRSSEYHATEQAQSSGHATEQTQSQRHAEDCGNIVFDTIASVTFFEQTFYDQPALLLHKQMWDIMSRNKEGLAKENMFIEWCRRVQGHTEAASTASPSTDTEHVFNQFLLHLPFRREAPSKAKLQSMLQDLMTWHASLLYSILRRPNHPGRANARMLAALGQTKWWMHGREDKETKDKVVEKDKYFKKTKDKVRISTGISKETVEHRPQKKQKVEQEKKEVDIAATKWKKSSEMQSNADQRLPMTQKEAEAKPAALVPPAAVKRIRSSSQMRAEALQERDLNSRLAAVDEYLGTLRDETLENLKDTLNQIFRSGKVKLVPRGSALSSSFSTDDKLDSFADEIRQIAKEHWLNVVIISDIAERWNQPEKEFAEAKDTDRPMKDKLTEVKQVMRVVGLGEESHDRHRKKRRRKEEVLD